MCEQDQNSGHHDSIEIGEYAAKRRQNLTRFLSEINSDRKVSDEAMDWWLEQY